MAAPKNLLRGAKFNGRHSTVISDAISIVQTAKELPEVTKIVLGVIKPLPSSKPHLRCSPVSAGLKVQVRGGSAVQIFFVYTHFPRKTELALRRAFDELS